MQPLKLIELGKINRGRDNREKPRIEDSIPMSFSLKTFQKTFAGPSLSGVGLSFGLNKMLFIFLCPMCMCDHALSMEIYYKEIIF